ncbi:MAG TPA: HAD-IA family hydrolase [Longimicrobiaceae bacterium]|nr:HAD-IA family hydrolase [Longimicrobiaceae bacterium]
MRIRAVLYDFDGTLADSTELIMRSYRHTMASHLGDVPPDEEWLSGFGMTLETQIARFARSAAETEAMLDTYRGFQREHHDVMLAPFPGTLETVDELRRRGVRLAIVTSKHRESALRGMDLCGIVDHFPVVVTPEDVAQPKPHPEPVLCALERLGVRAEEAVFVGDSPHDMAAGRAAGTRTAGALWGPFPREALERERPDWMLAAPGDVLSLLD